MRIIGYTYRAAEFCGDCILEVMVANGMASPAALDMATEDALDQIAGANAIDRDDEWSFDSNDFPKVILSMQHESDHDCYCGVCGGSID